MRRAAIALTGLLLVGCGGDAKPPPGPTPRSTVTLPQATAPEIEVTAPSPDDPAVVTESIVVTAVPSSAAQVDLSIPVNADPRLGANPAFLEQGYGITPVDCQLPAWANDPAAAEAYYAAALACHDASWADTVGHFGFAFRPVKLWAGAEAAAYDGACNDYAMTREAFYCSRDETVVMPFDAMVPVANYGVGNVLAVVSHEYGHHLQQLFGITAAYAQRRNAAGWESDAGQLLSRQFELQAWCTSGMFYGTNVGRGSITERLSERAFDNNSHAGDRPGELREHGSNANAGGWFAWGRHPSQDPAAAVAPSVYECNPWAARSASSLE